MTSPSLMISPVQYQTCNIPWRRRPIWNHPFRSVSPVNRYEIMIHIGLTCIITASPSIWVAVPYEITRSKLYTVSLKFYVWPVLRTITGELVLLVHWPHRGEVTSVNLWTCVLFWYLSTCHKQCSPCSWVTRMIIYLGLSGKKHQNS